MLCLPRGQMGDGAKAVNKGSIPPSDEENPDKKHLRQTWKRKTGRLTLRPVKKVTVGGWWREEGIRKWPETTENDGGLALPESSPHCNPTAIAATTKPTTPPRTQPSLYQWPWDPPPTVHHRAFPASPIQQRREGGALLDHTEGNHEVHSEVQSLKVIS